MQTLLLPHRFQKDANIAVLPEAGEVGTNKAFIGKGDGSGQSTKATTQQLLMPKRFQISGMSTTERHLHDAETAAGLGSVMTKEHLVPQGKKATTQTLLMPSRFRQPTTQSQRTRYEVGRAVGGHARAAPESGAQAATEARHMAEQRAEAVRVSQRKDREALSHAQEDLRRHSHAAAAVGLARMQELSSQYLDYGRKARSEYMKHGLVSPAENKWADKLMSGWEKAPVTMLAEKPGCGYGGPCTEVTAWNLKHGITSAKEEDWARGMEVENAADKAPTSMLSMSDDFDPQGQGDDNYATGVSAEVHRQYPGVNDQQGFPSTGMLRAPVQSLLLPERFTAAAKAATWPMLGEGPAAAVRVPDAFGSLGTAAQPVDPVFQAQAARGVSQLKQLFAGSAPARRVGDDVAAFLFKPAHAAGF